LKRLVEQAACVLSEEPDVVCLQEVTKASAPLWVEALRAGGLAHVLLADIAARRDARRPLGVLTAAREAISEVPVAGLPWPERVLSVRRGGDEIVNVHSPVSPSPGLAKVLTHEALFEHLAARAGHPRIVCGDFNTPRSEKPDRTIWTFARTQHGKLRQERGERWDAAELALLRGLEQHGFRDAYRELHGWDPKNPSWEWPRWGGGYRLDHLVVSDDVRVARVEYRHEWRRELRLSDHSALVAEVDAG
jgi:endonuclease/exonuclease/phosphatase family metal-dependent hydrolase